MPDRPREPAFVRLPLEPTALAARTDVFVTCSIAPHSNPIAKGRPGVERPSFTGPKCWGERARQAFIPHGIETQSGWQPVPSLSTTSSDRYSKPRAERSSAIMISLLFILALPPLSFARAVCQSVRFQRSCAVERWHADPAPLLAWRLPCYRRGRDADVGCCSSRRTKATRSRQFCHRSRR